MSSQEKNIGSEAEQVMTVRVDFSRCGGHARCMEESPDVFGYDSKTNKAFILPTANVNEHRDSVARAIRGCPEFALRWADAGESESE